MPHCFEEELAVKYGILEAILLNYFRFWILKNKANEKHFHDGRYWTYNSIKAFCDLFPYASTKMIRNALDHLEDEGLLMTGNFNKSPFDQTKWYALTEKGMSIFPKREVDLPHRANESCPTGQIRVAPEGKPIPVNNTDNKTINNNIVEIVSYLNEKTGSRYKSTTTATRKHIKARLEEGFTVEDFRAVINKKSAEWLEDKKMRKFLRPETLFGPKFESYLNQPTSQEKQLKQQLSDLDNVLSNFLKGEHRD